MTKKPGTADPAKGDREARLAAALRENLRRRKEQARARAEGNDGADDRPPPTVPPGRE